MAKLLTALSAAALLAACEARVGNEAGSGNASAEGKAEDGRVTIDTPGMELKINIPEGLRDRARIDSDDRLLYPGSNVAGVHVSAGEEGPDGRSDGEVEIAFTNGDSPDQVAAWYRDPARAADFALGGGAAGGGSGGDQVISGTTADGGEFQVRLSPRPGGGTDGRLLVRDSRPR